jgi:hypothetical protein
VENDGNHPDVTTSQIARTTGTGHQTDESFQQEVREALARMEEKIDRFLGQQTQKQGSVIFFL